MDGLLKEIAATVPVVDEDETPGKPKLVRASSLRRVPPEAIHYVPPFSAIIDEIESFPQFALQSSPYTPSLYLGSLVAAKNREALIAHNCRHVLTVLDVEESPYADSSTPASPIPDEATGAPARPYRKPLKLWEGIQYKRLTVRDDVEEDILRHFAPAHEFISAALAAGSSVLVHCRAGISRSATIVISYLMKAKGWSFETALKHVQARRGGVRPNDGFLKQLEQYERLLSSGSGDPMGAAPPICCTPELPPVSPSTAISPAKSPE